MAVLTDAGGLNPRMAIWIWYHMNESRVVFNIFKIYKIRIRDLRFIIEEIAGPEKP